jgi:trimethylamine:corrinoid methyltransferase-like protein
MAAYPSNYCAPKFRLRDDSHILRIHHSVLRILDEVGVRIYHNQALDLLTSNGARIKADNVFQIPSFMIEEAIAAAPILTRPMQESRLRAKA